MMSEKVNKMGEAFIDSDNKIITGCPKCGNQNAVYLICSNQIKDGFKTEWCDNCKLPYVIELKVELTAQIRYYSCKEEKNG